MSLSIGSCVAGCIVVSVMFVGCLYPLSLQGRRSSPPVVPQPQPSPRQPQIETMAPEEGTPPPSKLSDATSSMSVEIQLMTGLKSVTVKTNRPLRIRASAREIEAPAGTATLTLESAHAPRRVFHVFARSFKPSEQAEAETYLGQWKQQGYSPEIVVLGQQYQTVDDNALENRILWVSMNQTENEAQAKAIAEKLKSQKVWAWVRSQTVNSGVGTVTLTSETGARSEKFSTPVILSSSEPIDLMGVKEGSAQRYTGELEVTIGVDGLLDIRESIGFEDYIAGVLPSEMPASWPLEALAAQAIAARSVSLATNATKHQLDGFWACSSVHCKVYKGVGARRPESDTAVMETASRVIVRDGGITPAVFCANCGGWTESNEAVWSSPPNAALRAVVDFSSAKLTVSGPEAYGIEKWLTTAPPAYCSADTKHYRWKKTFTALELTRLINEKYAVGSVREIQLGKRGPGGRLEWVNVIGVKSSVVIEKEYPIRQAFGMLPSAMFIIKRSTVGGGEAPFTFIGAGNGHGVGLCQYGARGMALAGADYTDILKHYFSGVDVRRIH